ncbi:hypothetical protein QA635_19860 [Bradyrhizobium brasilense]|nr:hypothetical protein [Bradyrhizobium australafricanum]WFU36549.1 hypothetical protein QA635_19860 [Bradyrhizobium australafricanum]
MKRRIARKAAENDGIFAAYIAILSDLPQLRRNTTVTIVANPCLLEETI